MTTADFLNLLITEVKNQNPLEPMKNSELLSQMSAIKSLEANTKMADQFTKLGLQVQLGSSAQMIGQQVLGKTAQGDEVKGVVQGVTVTGQTVNLVVDGEELPLENIEEIAGKVPSNGA
jgi:flagellar basal-body rod modification protein FlgD